RARTASAHEPLDARLWKVAVLADAAVDGGATHHRQQLHHLYLELASFTAAYLEHQDLEERVLMPALEAAIGVDAVLEVHQAIIAGIPPDRFSRFLAVMLP